MSSIPADAARAATGTAPMAIPAWDGADLTRLLAMDDLGDGRFRTRCGDANAHGRAFGGQILAQALAAAARTVPDGRACTVLQFLFLQGTEWDAPLDLQVTPLQDGKRFSSRHVRGSQAGGRIVLDAQATFAVAIDAPAHQEPLPAGTPDPEGLPAITDLPPSWSRRVSQSFGYVLGVKPALDFRFVDPPSNLALTHPRLRFWLRLRQPLPGDAHLHAAALAYLSDWWLNYAAVGSHQHEAVETGGLYVASLNHAVWFHRPLRADDWLHVDCHSPAAAAGRGLTFARVHDRSGRLVASCSQENLMAPRGG